MPREGPEQARRRRTVNGISKKWKIARQSKRPRGLVNARNNCYRHGVLQPLLHLPRFVNWIKKHDRRGIHWPCQRDDPNPEFPPEPLTQEVLQDESWKTKTAKEKQQCKKKPDESEIREENSKGHDPELYNGCVPCLLKDLMNAYWKNTDIGGRPDFLPQPFPHEHKAIFPLHQLAERRFCVNPPGHLETLEDLPAITTQEEKDRKTRAARRAHMTDEQDADEFARHIFAGIQSSYDRSTPQGAARGLEYDSLFSVRQREVHTCDQCYGNLFDRIEDLAQGLIVFPRVDIKNDTVKDALTRSLIESREGSCGVCKVKKVNLDVTRSIIAAPEYLRIYISPYAYVTNNVIDENGKLVPVRTMVKNPRHIEIPDILDITQHMDYLAIVKDPHPVRYKLVFATYHQGRQITAGHYTAAVTGPALPGRRTRPQFFCNDATITDLTPTAAHPNAITRNPMNGSFDATTLYYERIAPTKGSVDPVKKRNTADQIIIDEGEAREKLTSKSEEDINRREKCFHGKE